jgi:hypothetical protein
VPSGGVLDPDKYIAILEQKGAFFPIVNYLVFAYKICQDPGSGFA